jgi:hypothetical protein
MESMWTSKYLIKSDFDDQADMCEIVRAMIAGGLIQGAKISELKEADFDAIDCPGESDKGQSEICAVNGGSAGQGYGWIIILEGMSVTASNNPQWEQDAASQSAKTQKDLKKQ